MGERLDIEVSKKCNLARILHSVRKKVGERRSPTFPPPTTPLNVPYRASTKLLFLNMKILPFDCINKLQVALFMYKIHSRQILSNFDHWFCKNSEVHDHYTRSSSNYHQTSVHTNIRQHSISTYGPLLWNSLPKELTCLPTVYQFKNKLKVHLLTATV